jgi:flagellar assembly factor FliW
MIMQLTDTRFGTVEVDESRTLTLPAGIIGFSVETRFALLEPPPGGMIAWLQSLRTPALAFPVIAASFFGDDYPRPALHVLGPRAQLGETADEWTALVVVASRRGARIANLLAPIVINLATRTGAQVVLDANVYSAAAPFQLEPRDVTVTTH